MYPKATTKTPDMKKLLIPLSLILSFIFSAYLLLEDDDVQTTFTSVEEALNTPENVLMLSLNDQDLKSLSGKIAQFKNLRTLNLSNNNLKVLPSAIRELHYLEMVNLSNNPEIDSKSVINMLSDCPRLKYLDMSGCRMGMLPHEIGHMRNLTFLDLSNNILTVLPNELTYLNELADLNLSGNAIIALDETFSGMSSLQKLDLRDNPKLELAASFKALAFRPELDELRLSHVGDLPDEWTLLPVKQLVFENSGIVKMQKAQQAESISGIVFENCPDADFKNLMDNMASMPALKSIAIRESGLDKLPGDFSQLTNVTALDLSGNNIVEVSEKVKRSKQLQQLNLSNNPIVSTEPKAIKNFLPDVHLMYSKEQFAAKQPRAVTPPIAGVDVPNEQYELKAEKGKALTYGDTHIDIPANAFRDAEGNVVTGAVDITYREFNDPVEIAVSGIPMQFDSAGQAYQFGSAGMIELRAYQNGEELLPNPNAPIAIDMPSDMTGDDYNMYYFDETAGKWEYMGNEEVSLPNLPDSIATAQNSPNRLERLKISPMSKPVVDFQKINFTVSTVRPGKSFTIHFHDYTASGQRGYWKEFPELRELRRYKWVYDGEEIDSTRQFLKDKSRKYYRVAKKVSKNDPMHRSITNLKLDPKAPSFVRELALEPNPEHDNYVMTIGLPDTTIRLEVYPQMNTGAHKTAQRKNGQLYKRYAKLHATRERTWRATESKYNRNLHSWEQEMKLIEAANRDMISGLADSRQRPRPSRRTFTLLGPNLGIINCDQIINITMPRPMVAVANTIYNDNMEEVDYDVMYVINYTYNTINRFEPKKGKYDRKCDIALMYTTSDDRIGFLSTSEFRKQTGDRRLRKRALYMHETSSDKTTLASLQKQLNSI